MSDLFYRFVCVLCTPPIALSSRVVALHRDRTPQAGPLILAPNHTSPYDVPCLMRSTPRLVDFLSVVEMKRKPLVGALYRAMNCVFVDRQRHDLAAARALLDRLQQNRAVALFPEGNIRLREKSVTNGGPFKYGVVKLAQKTGAPIQPCVLLNSERYSHPMNWLPGRRWAFGINYGELIYVARGAEAFDRAVEQLRSAYMRLHDELTVTLKADTSAREKTPGR